MISPIITTSLVRASDRRKAAQEDAIETRKKPAQDKLRDEESLYKCGAGVRSGASSTARR